MSDEKKILYSGMQATNSLTLGNYLGALKNWVNLNEEFDCFFGVMDLHSLTVRQNPTEFRQNARKLYALYVAAGLDPEVNCVYYQSHVPAHTQLAWILDCFTYMGELNRMTQFKDKSAKHADNINAGLFTYPVLMAADILLYQANVVPVGKDQMQHLEITRDIARRFNNLYGEFFHEAKPLLNECSLICGLDGNKMGKSYHNDIKISDSAEETSKKIMTAITDRSRLRKDDLGHPDECEVVYKYWKIFGTDEEISTVRSECEQGLRGCMQCKRQLGDKINQILAPIREKRKYYEEHLDEVDDIIRAGSAKAKEKASQILDGVKELVKIYK